MKNSRPGLIDQCRSITRPAVSSDTVPYQGKYFTARHLTHGFKDKPAQWLENFDNLALCSQAWDINSYHFCSRYYLLTFRK